MLPWLAGLAGEPGGGAGARKGGGLGGEGGGGGGVEVREGLLKQAGRQDVRARRHHARARRCYRRGGACLLQDALCVTLCTAKCKWAMKTCNKCKWAIKTCYALCNENLKHVARCAMKTCVFLQRWPHGPSAFDAV